jgi:hypothetical protein
MNSEYITLFRRNMNGLEKVNEQDWHKLQKLSDKLIKEIQQGIITPHPKPDISYRMLVVTLQELTAEKQVAIRALNRYRLNLDLAGLDDYTSNLQDVGEWYDTLETTIANLYIMLAGFYPDTLKNKTLRNDIAKAIMPYPNLGKAVKAKIRMLNEADETVNGAAYNNGKPDYKNDRNAPSEIIRGPIINPNIITPLFENLKLHFASEQHNQLKELLTNGVTSGKLHFRSNGNRLADAFKQLIKADLIINCTQKQLEIWIGSSFTYQYREIVKVFTDDYLEKCISRNEYPCKNPLKGIEKIIK